MVKNWVFNRVRDMLLYPQKTWDAIKEEKDNKMLVVYPVILSLIQPAAIIIGYSIFGKHIGLAHPRMIFLNSFFCSLVAFFFSILGIGIMSFLIMILSNYFAVDGDLFTSLKLSVYSSTAPLVAGIFQLIPDINILMILGLYGAYILFIGIPKLMKVPHDKEQQFIFSTVIAGVVVILMINLLISQYISGILYADILTY